MSTKAQQFHADEQRSGRGAKTRPGRSRPGAAAGERSRASKHAAKKATVALEETTGKPSRKSTRKSANRAKPDASLNIREEMQQNTPTARARRAKAKG